MGVPPACSGSGRGFSGWSLRSVAGEIEQVTGGRTMDRILRRCQEDLDALATGSRLSPKGAWKDAVDEAKALEAELEVLERQCAELSDALNDRRAAEAELRRLDEPEAKAQRDTDLGEAREVARAAESYAQTIASAQGELDLALMRQSEAERARDALIDAVSEAESASKALDEADQLNAERLGSLKPARVAEGALRSELEEADSATRALREEQKQAERAGRIQRAREEVERIGDLLKQARGHAATASECRARIAANPVTEQALADLEDAAKETARLQSLIAANSVRMHVEYVGDTRLSLAGAEIAGGDAVALKDGAEVEVPGIATLRFELPEAKEDHDVKPSLPRRWRRKPTSWRAARSGP